jgi:hypothetical protein
MSDKTGAHWIQLNIAQSLPKVIFIHRTGKKSLLPEMTNAIPSNILPSGKIILRSAKSLCERGLCQRDGDIMSMIGHQRVADHLDLESIQVSTKEFQIGFAFHIIVEDDLAVIASLSDMVRATGDNNTSDSRHHS